MFTKSDYADYCQQIIALENKMEIAYRQTASQLTNTEYINIFEQLAREEVNHADTARDLLKILTSDNNTP